MMKLVKKYRFKKKTASGINAKNFRSCPKKVNFSGFSLKWPVIPVDVSQKFKNLFIIGYIEDRVAAISDLNIKADNVTH